MAAAKTRYGWIGVLSGGVLVAFGAGFATGLAHPPDAPTPGYVLDAASAVPPAARYTIIDERHRRTDPAGLIRIGTSDDVGSTRERLVERVWGAGGLPITKLPDAADPPIQTAEYAGWRGATKVSRSTIRLDGGITSVVDRFEPAAPGGAFVIYHGGHRQTVEAARPTIEALLARGFTVAAMMMPLYGTNNRPTVDLPRFGGVRLESHNQLPWLDVGDGHPVKILIEPVIVVVNQALADGYQAVHMVGLSGGGWTTTLAAAVDRRIVKSYPVAGSLPLFLREEQFGDFGDWEQTAPELYRVANYLELYVLGAVGDGRRQLQVLNQFDPCCFGGVRYRTYERAVGDRVRALGAGHFAVWLDDSHSQHQLSKEALQTILDDLQSDGASRPPPNTRQEP